MFTFANLIGNLLFSGVGFVAFVYGKKMVRWKAMLLGVLLMIYPWFVSGTLMLYGVGLALTALLYLTRERYWS